MIEIAATEACNRGDNQADGAEQALPGSQSGLTAGLANRELCGRHTHRIRDRVDDQG